MRRLQNDLIRRIHDQVFARDLSRISDEEWIIIGAHFTRPDGEGSSSSSSSSASGATSNAKAFKLYFKSLVREDTVRGVKTTTAGMGLRFAISETICCSKSGNRWSAVAR